MPATAELVRRKQNKVTPGTCETSGTCCGGRTTNRFVTSLEKHHRPEADDTGEKSRSPDLAGNTMSTEVLAPQLPWSTAEVPLRGDTSKKTTDRARSEAPTTAQQTRT